MRKIRKILSVALAVALLSGSLIASAEEKSLTVIIGNKNVVAGGTGKITVTPKNFGSFEGAFNFEIGFPEIAEIKNVYLNGNKLTALSDGGSDYNIRSDNTLVLAGLCNHGDETVFDDNTVYHIEFTTPKGASLGEYPVEFTEKTCVVSNSDDGELILPVTVNGVINLTERAVYKADIDESGSVDTADMAALRKLLLGIGGTAFNKIAADVNEDRAVDIRDLIAIKKYLAQTVTGQTKALPDTGGVVEAVSGGAETEAAALRKAIDEAEDELVVTGNKYYVSQNGDDGNDGTTPEKAFKTLKGLESINDSLQSGDGVFLERGSVFRVDSDSDFGLILKNGVTYGAYGEGEKPAVYGSERSYAEPGLWTETENENVWQMNFDAGDAGIIVLDGGSEVGKKQMYLNELTVNDDFYHDWDNKLLYFYCDRGNPGEVFGEMEIGTKKELFHLLNNRAKDVKIDNISFSYSGTFAIRGMGNASGITVTNCSFSWIGGSLYNNKSNRYGNAIEFSSGCENITVKSCSFKQIFDSGVTFQIGNDAYRNFTVEGCLFEYNGMSAFEWFTQGDSGKQDGIPIDITVIEDITFKNNIARFTGYGWSKATRSPAHIRNAWSTKWYPNMKDFVISNNIFDCANGQIIASPWISPPDGYTVRGNTYYQRNVKATGADGMYLPFTPINGANEYVTNYEEFVWAVSVNDESPGKIEWLE